MKPLPIIFQFSLYGLTALTGLMMAFAEETVWPAGITLPIVVFAFHFVERQHRFLLPTLWSNVLGVGIFCLAGYEGMGEQEDARVIALSHLLVYLTWLVLFQEKKVRQYWWLCALSMLQVAMGSLLTLSGWYGILLMSYVLTSVWTLAVFMLYQGQLRFAFASPSTLIAESPDASAAERVSIAEGSVHHEEGEAWVTPRFFYGVMGLALSALVFSTGLYLLVPVVWTSTGSEFIRQVDSPLRPMTGFSERVRLGDMGEILESTQPVMQVRLVDYDSDAPRDINEYAAQWGHDEPLFRGIVLEKYENGLWSPLPLKASEWRLPTWPKSKMLRLEVLLQPIGTQPLFTLHPFRAGYLKGWYEDRISIRPETEVLTVSRRMTRQPLEYRTLLDPDVPSTEAGRSSMRRRPMLPIYENLQARIVEHRGECLNFPERGLDRLRDLALQVIQQPRADGSAPATPLAKARALESHLRDSGFYTYTLSAAVQDPTIDPVEDFLFNRKTGHCEYFASALALMLRAVGVPSRVVTGFKGGFYGSPGGYYEVQQRHAHSWVEAFVDDEWITLDGTPSVARNALVQSLGHRNLWQVANDFFSGTWSTYVVNMNAQRQDESVYGPLQAALRGGWASVATSRLSSLWDSLRESRAIVASPKRWFSAEGGATAFAWLVILVAFFALIRGIGWLAKAARRGARHRQRRLSRVEFLERFVKLLAAQGIHWQDGETPREFAQTSQGLLADRLSRCKLSTFPTDLAELYYRVRFGDQPLSATESTALNSKLADLEKLLNGS